MAVMMNVRFTVVPWEIMLMLVVFVIPVGARMLHRVARVFVLKLLKLAC